MGTIKPISHKELNQFIKGKGFKGKNNYKFKELKAEFGFKPMYDRRTLVDFPKDMEPTEFDSMRKAAKAIGVGEGALGMQITMGKTSSRTKAPRSSFHKVVFI